MTTDDLLEAMEYAAASQHEAWAADDVQAEQAFRKDYLRGEMARDAVIVFLTARLGDDCLVHKGRLARFASDYCDECLAARSDLPGIKREVLASL